MGTNIEKFNDALRKAETKILKEDFQKFVIQVALETFRRIVLRTPVDTGRARGNWQIEINRPAEGVYEIEGDAETLFQDAINREIGKLEGIPNFCVIHITNNVNYVYYLEYDKRSSQHPEGMVEITLKEMGKWLSKISRTI